LVTGGEWCTGPEGMEEEEAAIDGAYEDEAESRTKEEAE
jgi:hypothetical protein